MIVNLNMSENELKLLRAFLAVVAKHDHVKKSLKLDDKLMLPILVEAERQLDNQLYPSSAS